MIDSFSVEDRMSSNALLYDLPFCSARS